MKSKTLSAFIVIIMIVGMIVSIGAEGNLTISSGDVSAEKIDNIQVDSSSVTADKVQDTTNEVLTDYISEEKVTEGERIESITPEDTSSENLGADPGQEEASEAPISSLQENVDYIPLEEVTGEENQTSSSPTPEKTNITSEDKSEGFEGELMNESRNQSVGSGQEEKIEAYGNFSNSSLGQKEVNETTKINEAETSTEGNHADVRGNDQEGTGSSPGGSVPTSSSGQKTINYVSIDEIVNELASVDYSKGNETTNNTQDTSENDSNVNVPKEKKLYSYYHEGKKVIEIETDKEVSINKEDFQENDFEKKVVISSEEHVEDPLRVYADMPQETLKKKIKILWKNEELDITNLENFSVKYYDENGNGLVDRVSWIVPHLSEQVFEIVVENNEASGNADLNEIKLNVDGPSGPVMNPIAFNITLNYSQPQFIGCSLIINSSANPRVYEKNITFGEGRNEEVGLQSLPDDSSYKWYLGCLNESGNVTPYYKQGSFSINEGFSVTSIEGKLFFLDLVKNTTSPLSTVTFSSNHLSKKNVEIKKGSTIVFTKTYGENDAGILVLDQKILQESGTYNLTVNFIGSNSVNKTMSQIFYVASANISFVPGTYDIGENIPIKFTANFPNRTINYAILRFGDNNDTLIGSSSQSLNEQATHTYQTEGNRKVSLEIGISGGSQTYSIEKSGINIEYSGDNSPPTIDLDYPEDGTTLNKENITFEYLPKDNVNVKNCTFRVYNMSGNEADEFTSVRQTNSSLGNGVKVKIPIFKFDNGNYAWEVECYDNSSNYYSRINLFDVVLGNSTTFSSTSTQFTDYAQKDDVEETIDKVNSFLAGEDNYDVDVKEVLNDLGISSNIEFYKKRLLTIDQYLKENYKYVEDATLRQQKEDEYLEEFENIKNSVPNDIEIIDSMDYVKNSVETDLEEVVQDYMDSTNTQISKGFAKKLAQMNMKLQQEISVEANIKQVKIVYENDTKEFILVKKKVDFKDSNHDQLLEVIPKNIVESADDVKFLVDNQIIKEDPIFEIIKEDLTDDDEIVYYIDESNTDANLKDFTKTETILFEESIQGKSAVTGFFAADIMSNSDPVYFAIAILLIICLIILFVFVSRKMKIQKWKKEPNVVKCFELLRKANIYIKEKDLERARENYREMKKVYPVLPPKPKEFFYEKIKELSIEIDKRDIFGLVKEYEEARKHWNKDDCLRIYKDIKKVYERLPLKYRQKIYERINRY